MTVWDFGDVMRLLLLFCERDNERLLLLLLWRRWSLPSSRRRELYGRPLAKDESALGFSKNETCDCCSRNGDTDDDERNPLQDLAEKERNASIIVGMALIRDNEVSMFSRGSLSLFLSSIRVSIRVFSSLPELVVCGFDQSRHQTKTQKLKDSMIALTEAHNPCIVNNATEVKTVADLFLIFLLLRNETG